MNLSSCGSKFHKPSTLRTLLTELRKGDYTHPGSEEAIDLIINKIASYNQFDIEQPVLDIGSGLGGTLAYFKLKGFKNVVGIDIDKNAVEYSQKKYTHLKFCCVDALGVGSVFKRERFSLIYLMNVIYAIKDKKRLLYEITKVSKRGTLLVLFDYSLPEINNPTVVHNLDEREIYPIQSESIITALKELGWECLELSDITDKYIYWYRAFLEELSINEKLLSKKFTVDDINKIRAIFSFILSQLEQDKMGGIIIYAKKVE